MLLLLQDGHELEDSKGAAHFQFREVAIQPAEDAGVVATDEEDLIALQFQVTVQGIGQHLHGGDEDAEGFGEQRDGGEELNFHERIWVAAGISGRGKGAGRK